MQSVANNNNMKNSDSSSTNSVNKSKMASFTPLVYSKLGSKELKMFKINVYLDMEDNLLLVSYALTLVELGALVKIINIPKRSYLGCNDAKEDVISRKKNINAKPISLSTRTAPVTLNNNLEKTKKKKKMVRLHLSKVPAERKKYRYLDSFRFVLNSKI